MRSFVIALPVMVPTLAIALEEGAIVAHGDAGRGDDFQMAPSCREPHRAAKAAADEMRVKARTVNKFDVILGPCAARWMTDYKMVPYRADRQQGAPANLKAPSDDLPGKTADQVGRKRSDRWDNDLPMVKYRRGRQADARRSLQQ